MHALRLYINCDTRYSRMDPLEVFLNLDVNLETCISEVIHWLG